MKKILSYCLILLSFLIFSPLGIAEAKTATSPKPTAAKTQTSKKAPKIVWTAAALKELRKVPAFVRAIVKAKINNYAAQHKIKTITPKLVKSIHV